MGAIRAYQGYFKDDGRFVPNDVLVKIPPLRRVIVNVLEEQADDIEISKQNQSKAFDEFFETMESLNKRGIELLDDEFDTILSNRVNISRELCL